MSWLNWSLKLYIRLRLSHLWYLHTSHMSMFNECLIHLCDCTRLNVLHMLKYMLIKHKNIFKCFNCFGKLFCFEKFQKLCNSILATHSRESIQSCASSRELTQKLSRLSGELGTQSRKRLGCFSKIWVFRFLVTQFGDFFVSWSSSCEFYS